MLTGEQNMKKTITLLLSTMMILACMAFFPACVHEHSLTHVEAKVATCITTGIAEHYYCDGCGKYFSDAGGGSEISKEDTIISINPDNHNFKHELIEGDVQNHKSICKDCNHEQTDPHNFAPIGKENIGHVYSGECDCGTKSAFLTLPVIKITANDGAELLGTRTSGKKYSKCTISVESTEEESYNLTDISGKVKVRGNYSADYVKKPYRIKFDKKQTMLGLDGGTKAKNWVLLADWKDGSKMRNATAFYLANEILGSDGYYSSDYRHVEVYVNNVYRGIYLLCDQQETGSARIDVPDDKEYKGTDMGYVLELDAYANGEDAGYWFSINYKNAQGTEIANMQWLDGSTNACDVGKFEKKYAIKSDLYEDESDTPDKDEETQIVTAQNAFIKKRLENTFSVVYDAVYTDHSDLSTNPYKTLDNDGNIIDDATITTSRAAVEKVVDLQSLVDTYILNEICVDIDVGWSSFRMSFDLSNEGNKLLTFQAPWDWDYSLGQSYTTYDKHHSTMPTSGTTASTHVNPWLVVLCRQGWFWDEVQTKWNEIYNRGVFTEAIYRINLHLATFKTYRDKDVNVDWNSLKALNNGSMGDYRASNDSSITELITFLTNRVTWLHSAIPAVKLFYDIS